MQAMTFTQNRKNSGENFVSLKPIFTLSWLFFFSIAAASWKRIKTAAGYLQPGKALS